MSAQHQTSGRPWTVAVVGGVCSGKSTVAETLASWGARLLDADRIAHSVLNEPDARQAILAQFGDGVADHAGGIDRAKLAPLVFGDSPASLERRRYLESVIHPRVKQRILDELDAAAREGVSAVVLDVPLLLEVGWRDLVEDVVFVEAPEDVRLARALSRGWSRAEWLARESAQLGIEQKRSAADLAVDNSGSRDDLEGQLRPWWQQKCGDKAFRGDENQS